MNSLTKLEVEINDSIKYIIRQNPEMNFQQGDCYKLYKMLKLLYPEAIAFYEPVTGHIYTLIANRLWDSKGLYMFPVESDIDLASKVESWSSK